MQEAPTPMRSEGLDLWWVSRGLNALVVTETTVGRAIPDCFPPPGDGPSNAQLRTAFLALLDEAHELMREVGWKMWKPNPPLDKAKILEEWADLFATFGWVTALVMLRADLSTDELVIAFRDKVKRVYRDVLERYNQEVRA